MASDQKYFEGVGRRKTAIARVRISEAKNTNFSVNEKSLEDFFKVPENRLIAKEAITKSKTDKKFSVSVKVSGGGATSQAEAIRHGVARALIKFNPELRKALKDEGFLKRDPRVKERRKFGLKKARKSPQWSKR